MKNELSKEEFLERVRKRIVNIMDSNGLSQAYVLAQAQEQGYTLRQSTLSKIISDGSSMSLSNIVQISNILNLDLNDLLSESENLDVRLRAPISSGQNNMRLIFDPKTQDMKPYLGEYYAYFFSTVSSEDKILMGKLVFEASLDKKRTLASFSFETGKMNAENKPIKKEYTGELFLSPAMSAAYCALKSEEIGEISYLIFNYKYINYEKLECKVLLSLTSSAGSNRVPTVHRMIITRKEIPIEELDLLRGQLYLNDSEILISESSLERFLADKRLDRSFVEYFTRPEQNIKLLGVSPVSYYYFDESIIRSAPLNSDVKRNAINLIRIYSASPRYNKVGNKCDDFVYQTITNISKTLNNKGKGGDLKK